MLQLVAHLHRIATGIHGQASLLQQLADLPLDQVFEKARAVTRETWGTIVDSPAGRCLKQVILGERALLFYRLAMLEEWAQAECAHVDVVAQEIWAKLDTWVGVRVNGENKAIHAVVDPVRDCIFALEPAEANGLDPTLFQVSEEQVAHFPPRKHVDEEAADGPISWTPAML